MSPQIICPRGFLQRLEDDALHYLVTGESRVNPVVSVVGIQRDAVFGDHRRKVVNVLDVILSAVLAQAGVERCNFFG